MYTNELRERLAEYRELKAQLARTQAALEETEQAIKAHMGEREELLFEGTRIRWTYYDSCRFDTAAFRQAHEELYRQFCKTTRSRRFTVT